MTLLLAVYASLGLIFLIILAKFLKLRLIIFISLLVLSWYFYDRQNFYDVYFLSSAIAAVVIGLLIYRAYRRKFNASSNVIAAAATFSTLEEDQQIAVHVRAIEIIKRSGWKGSEPEFQWDGERYGWYALAMGELGIRPIGFLTHWNHIRNPFIALSPSDTIIDTAVDAAAQQGLYVHIGLGFEESLRTHGRRISAGH